MNVEIGADAALFLEKEYMKGIFVAVWKWQCMKWFLLLPFRRLQNGLTFYKFELYFILEIVMHIYTLYSI